MRPALLATLGVMALALGVIGIFVPGIPTTEFVIAASYLFARSSPRLNDRLERNRWLGPSLRRFREQRGMPRTSKALAILSMWTGISMSVYAWADGGAVFQVLVVSMGVIGTTAILFFVRTAAARQSLILS